MFSLLSIIITITSNEPWNTETHKMYRNPPITNHKPWPFEPVKVKFCFLRGPLRWLTAAKNAIVSWLLNFRIRMFVKSAVKAQLSAKLCPSCYVDCNHFWCLILTGWGKTGNGILGEIGDRRGMGDGRGKSQRWEYWKDWKWENFVTMPNFLQWKQGEGRKPKTK